MPYFNSYIDDESARALRAYKYAGRDLSFLYNYVFNPFYNVAIEYFPPWLAPNLITLVGFCFPLLSYAIMAHYCPFLDGEAPPAAYLFNGAALLIYLMLDSLDGKQARRTGTSSPLGLLFDHGCDAVNACLSALTLASSLQLGATWKSTFLVCLTAVVFYAATWEEYFTGELVLPVINGPNEGVVVAVLFHLLPFFFGPNAWLTEVSTGPLAGVVMPQWLPVVGGTVLPDTMHAHMLALGFTACASLFTIAGNFVNVCAHVHKEQAKLKLRLKGASKGDSKGSDASSKVDEGESKGAIEVSSRHGTPGVMVALTRWIPILLVTALFAGWVTLSPSGILAQSPRLVLWGFALLYAKLVTQVMLAHLTASQYRPYGKTVGIILYLLAHAAYLAHQDIKSEVIERLLAWEFFAVSAFSYAHLILHAVWEVSAALGVKVFTIDGKMAAAAVKADRIARGLDTAPASASTLASSSGAVANGKKAAAANTTTTPAAAAVTAAAAQDEVQEEGRNLRSRTAKSGKKLA